MNCYMITSRGYMPGTISNSYTDNGVELTDVLSPNGKIYTTRSSNVLDIETGALLMIRERASNLIKAGYQIFDRCRDSFRVYNSKKHTRGGGYIVNITRDYATCTCPCFVKNRSCKHIIGCVDLLLERARQAGEKDYDRVAARFTNLAHKLLAYAEETPDPVADPPVLTKAEREAINRKLDEDLDRDFL